MIGALLVIIGIAFLFVSGEFLIRSTVALSGILKVPTFVIALTLVAFGTSAPELAISVDAAISGYPGIAVGNVIGSNIANVILAVPIAILARPIRVVGIKKIDCAVLFLFTFLFIVFVSTFYSISFYTGFFMILMLVLYLFWTIVDAKKGNRVLEEIPNVKYNLYRSIFIIIFALVGVILGAEILIKGAVIFAKKLGTSQTIIGLSLVAIGTSLPEIVTSFIAAIRGSGGFLIGAVVGSNLFNLFGITGVASMISSIRVENTVNINDFFMLALTTLLLILIALIKKKINRIVAFFMLLLHIGYITTLYVL